MASSSTQVYFTSGTTSIGITNNNKLFMASDGYGCFEKIFETGSDGVLRRIDLYQERTPDFREGSPAMNYYKQLIDTLHAEYVLDADDRRLIAQSWEERKKLVVTSIHHNKIYEFNKNGDKILATIAGSSGLFMDIEERLNNFGENLGIQDCLDISKAFVEKTNPRPEFQCDILFGTFQLQPTGARVPVLYHVKKNGQYKLVDNNNYKCLGHGKRFVKKVFGNHSTEGTEDRLVVRRLREALEAGSVERMSGGYGRIVSLSEDNVCTVEWSGRMGI